MLGVDNGGCGELGFLRSNGRLAFLFACMDWLLYAWV